MRWTEVGREVYRNQRSHQLLALGSVIHSPAGTELVPIGALISFLPKRIPANDGDGGKCLISKASVTPEHWLPFLKKSPLKVPVTVVSV